MYNRLVRNKRLILSLPLLLAASLIIPSHVVPSAYAQLTGLVCITGSPTGTSCDASPPSLGPFTVGQTFTVGVFVQGSDAMGGFDIYVSSDNSIVNPTSATLGTLIASPTLTSICVNGLSQVGSCTPNTANGAGVVEVNTIESSGTNECGGISPCSGMAFTITYQVIALTSGTPLFFPSAPGCGAGQSSPGSDICVTVDDSFGDTLSENIQGATLQVVLATPSIASTIIVDNTGQPLPAGGILLGTSVHDVAMLNGGAPPQGVTGTVTYTLYPNTGCAGTGTVVSTVNVGASDSVPDSASVTPSPAGSYSFNAVYSGDRNNNAVTSACEPFTVSDFSITAASRSMSIPFGGIGQDIITVTSLGSFTGDVTLTSSQAPSGDMVVFVPNPATITTSGGSANPSMQISISPTAAAGTSFTLTVMVKGTLVHSVSVTVKVVAGPSLVGGKLSWTNHLSLSRSSNAQSWTATVANPLSSSINVVIRIVGASTTNPANSFDVTCGVTCVNTAGGGVNSTPGLTPVSVAAGATSFSFSFSQPISSSFANQKISFTATLYWTTGTVYSPSNSKSGTFAVTP